MDVATWLRKRGKQQYESGFEATRATPRYCLTADDPKDSGRAQSAALGSDIDQYLPGRRPRPRSNTGSVGDRAQLCDNKFELGGERVALLKEAPIQHDEIRTFAIYPLSCRRGD